MKIWIAPNCIERSGAPLTVRVSLRLVFPCASFSVVCFLKFHHFLHVETAFDLCPHGGVGAQATAKPNHVESLKR